MSEPQTAAGNRLVGWLTFAAKRGFAGVPSPEFVAAIEQEAATAERARIAEEARAHIAVWSQPNGPHIYGRGGIHADATKCGACGRLHAWRAILALLEASDDC